MITHNQLSAGAQTLQTAHAVADWIVANPGECERWKQESNSIIALATKTEEDLYKLLDKLKVDSKYMVFREPDFGNAITAIAVTPADINKKMLANLPLAGKITDAEQEKLKVEGERKKRKASFDMLNTDQTEGQNILEHGESVYKHYLQLKDHLEGKINLGKEPSWVIPEWLNENSYHILRNLPSDYVMERYLMLHDCGKPSVAVMVDGRNSFPGHAAASVAKFRSTFAYGAESESDELISYFIEHDMDVHLLKADGVDEFTLSEHFTTQLIVALAEITANAGMFGGVNSVGFKIKYKTLIQRAKKAFRKLDNMLLEECV